MARRFRKIGAKKAPEIIADKVSRGKFLAASMVQCREAARRAPESYFQHVCQLKYWHCYCYNNIIIDIKYRFHRIMRNKQVMRIFFEAEKYSESTISAHLPGAFRKPRKFKASSLRLVG